jgi:GNAT superfamily N-acetyltransferase
MKIEKTVLSYSGKCMVFTKKNCWLALVEACFQDMITFVKVNQANSLNQAKSTDMKTSFKYVKRWYLEMNEAPNYSEIAFPENISIAHFSGNAEDYRQLNKLVGGDLGWVDRQIMDEAELEKILQNRNTKIFEIAQNDQTVGFAELDFMENSEVEMHYFGLIPEARGKGLGKPFLQWAIAEAWKSRPKKFKLNTCEIDHPGALSMYLKAGFIIVDEKVGKQAVIASE